MALPSQFTPRADLEKFVSLNVRVGSQRDRGNAFPTSEWWTNLVACRPDRGGSRPSQSDSVWSHPYILRVRDQRELTVGYPRPHRVDGPTNANGAVRYYLHPAQLADMVLGASDWQVQTPVLNVNSWDCLGVNISLVDPSTTGGSISSHLAMGMAYVSAEYQGLTPQVSSPNAVVGIEGVDQIEIGMQVPFVNNRVVLSFNSGQKWIVYVFPTNPGDNSVPTVTLSSLSELSFQEKFSGVVRTAMLPSLDLLDVYDKGASTLVNGVELDLFDSSTYKFRWSTRHLGNKQATDDAMLHFALPHHQDVLDTTDKSAPTEWTNLELGSCTRGTMRGVLSSGETPTWTCKETRDPVIARLLPGTDPSEAELVGVDFDRVLETEIKQDWNVPADGSYYFNGKLLQKYASLCLLAQHRNLPDLLSTGVEKLKNTMEMYVANKATHPLVYDEVFGGIITSEGFTRNDMNADFGNGLYNDHHFHYGYFVTAFSIMAQLDPGWARSTPALQDFVDTLIRDAASSDPSDPLFPYFRHFNWFHGHSYAHGITSMADGKDQESVSEEMNFHYGMLLWAEVTENRRLADIAQLMLKVNKRSIQSYFLMKDDNTVHPPEFVPNKVTGIFFDNKVDYTTWFSPNPECIHGIQMIPVSPILPYFRDAEFVREEWESILSKIDLIRNPSAHSGWESLLYANYAMIEPRQALTELQTCHLDDGLTRSWGLYFALSMLTD